MLVPSAYAQAEAGHAEWIGRDWLHAQLDPTVRRSAGPAIAHALGHGVEIEHSALVAGDQRRLDHPSLAKPLQVGPVAARDEVDLARYQVSELTPQSMGRLVGVSLRVEVSTPTAERLVSLPAPAARDERHRHSASGFLRAPVEGGAKVVRVAARDQGGGQR